MRIALGLLALTLLGCQSSSAPPLTSAPEPVRVVTSAPPEVAPPAPRRPLVRLNPRRQRLQVGDAPPQARPRPRKVGVQVLYAPPQAPPQSLPVYQPRVSVQVMIPSVPTSSWPPPAAAPRATVARGRAQVESFMAQEERIRQNNEMLMNRPQPGQGMTLQMQQISYPQMNYRQPQIGPSLAHKQAEHRYLEARADFLNTKHYPNAGTTHYRAEDMRGMIGTGMPLPPNIMNQPAMFNPVLQKAQQAEVLRQEMNRTP